MARCARAPYKLDSWVVGDGVTVARYDDYWDERCPQVAKITFKGVPDEAALTSGLLTGEIDGTYPPASRRSTELGRATRSTVTQGPAYAIAALSSVDLDGTLGDVKVRQALSMALDRKGIVDTCSKGAEDPRALANPGTWGYGERDLPAAWTHCPSSSPGHRQARRR